jgi:tetratricopeptide (TPR) repeat protein
MNRAQTAWVGAARQRGDFQRMAVRAISDMTYWTAMAQLRLGEREEANETFRSIYNYSIELEQTEPTIDYFATSLPTMLLFEEDLARRNHIEALVLRGQALLGLERTQEAIAILHDVLGLDSNHTAASDLLHQNQAHRVGSR